MSTQVVILFNKNKWQVAVTANDSQSRASIIPCAPRHQMLWLLLQGALVYTQQAYLGHKRDPIQIKEVYFMLASQEH